MSTVAVLGRYTSLGLRSPVSGLRSLVPVLSAGCGFERNLRETGDGRRETRISQEYSRLAPGLIQWVSVSPMFRRRQPADADAFGAEILRYLEPLYATALRLTRNRADAEDLVQDTFVKALRFSDRFERGTNLRAWLSTILHNTWRNRLRDTGREAAAVEVDSTRLEEAEATADHSQRGETPEQLLIRNTLDADLRTALDELPDIFRQAVWLRDVEEFSYAEIAKMLDVPIGTVMSRISRGRRMLFDQLRKTKATA
jgi:RNA polymerase sigma-70 factor, ECF subfamily